MRHDLQNLLKRLDIDTSIQQARSRVDGRVYPVDRLSEDQIEELARCLDIAIDERVAWALNDAVRASVRNLAAFFDTTAETVAAYEAERLVALKRIAADPARGIDEPWQTAGARGAIDVLLSHAKAKRIDPDTRLGAIALGDLAAKMTVQKKPRADAHFTVGETQLFDDIIAAIALFAPEALSLPGNDPTPRGAPSNTGADKRYRAVDFAEEFVGQVVDRTLASFPADGSVQERLYRLKRKSTQSMVKAMRVSRAWLRANASDAATGELEF